MDSRQRHIIQTVYDRTGLAQFKKDMQTAGKVSGGFGTKIAQDAKFAGMGIKKSFDKAGNVITTKTATFVKSGKQMKVAWQEGATGAKALGVSVGKAGTSFSNFSAMLGKAVKRALIVAPVWLALRSAMMLVIRTIGEGMKYWVEWDKQLMKSKAVIHGVAGSIEGAFGRLRKEVKELAIATGESMTKITSAFYRFGTVGLDFETSIAGMKTATDLAMAMFGDADQIARVLAQSYRLLGHTIDQSIPPQERMQVIGAQLYKLWKTNAFEINEMTGALQRFLPTANAFNFTMTESLGLLATLQTAGLKATKAGRLLASGINRLVGNLDKISSILGVYVNPKMDTTFAILMKVLGAIKDLSDSGGNLAEIFKAIGIFGGVRQRQAGLALIALYDTLLDNWEAIRAGNIEELMTNLGDRVDEVTDSVGRQAQITEELRKQLGMAFLQGLFGGEEFADTLTNINSVLKMSIRYVRNFADGLRLLPELMLHIVPPIGLTIKYFRVKFEKQLAEALETQKLQEKIRKAIIGELSLIELEELKMELLFRGIEIVGIERIFEQVNEQIAKQMDVVELKEYIEKAMKTPIEKIPVDKLKTIHSIITENIEALKKEGLTAEEYIKIIDKRLAGEKHLSTEIQNRVQELQTELELLDMELRGVSNIDQAQQDLNETIKKQSEAYTIAQLKQWENFKEFSKDQLKGTKEYNKALTEVLGLTTKWLKEGEEGQRKLMKVFMPAVIIDFYEKIYDVQKEGLRDIYGREEKLDKFRLNMAKRLGASELELLGIEERIFKTRENQYLPLARANVELDIQLRKEIALQNQTLKRRQLYVSIIDKMISMTKTQRKALEEAVEVMRLTPEQIKIKFPMLSPSAQKQLFEFRNILDPERTRAVVESMARVAGISKTLLERVWAGVEKQPEIKMERIIAKTMEIINPIKAFFEEPAWIKMKKPGEEWKTLWERQPLTPQPGAVGAVNITPGNIVINIDKKTKMEIAEDAGKKFKIKVLDILDTPEGKRIMEDTAWNMEEKG